jgi:hypothetical protein
MVVSCCPSEVYLNFSKPSSICIGQGPGSNIIAEQFNAIHPLDLDTYIEVYFAQRLVVDHQCSSNRNELFKKKITPWNLYSPLSIVVQRRKMLKRKNYFKIVTIIHESHLREVAKDKKHGIEFKISPETNYKPRQIINFQISNIKTLDTKSLFIIYK